MRFGEDPGHVAERLRGPLLQDHFVVVVDEAVADVGQIDEQHQRRDPEGREAPAHFATACSTSRIVVTATTRAV